METLNLLLTKEELKHKPRNFKRVFLNLHFLLTYEELKPKSNFLCCSLIDLIDTYLRNWNAKNGFSKREDIHFYLPMRNWNHNNVIFLCKKPPSIYYLPMRNWNYYSRWGKNSFSWKFTTYLRGMKLPRENLPTELPRRIYYLPMRNWNTKMVIHLETNIWNLLLTYEELKRFVGFDWNESSEDLLLTYEELKLSHLYQ